MRASENINSKTIESKTANNKITNHKIAGSRMADRGGVRGLLLAVCLTFLICLLAGCTSGKEQSADGKNESVAQKESESGSGESVSGEEEPESSKGLKVNIVQADLTTEEMKEFGLTVVIDELAAEGEGSEKLNDALRQIDGELEEKIRDLAESDYFQELKSMWDADTAKQQAPTLHYEAEILRLDEQIFCVYYRMYDDFLCEGSDICDEAFNVDVRTGELLYLGSLPGIVEDPEYVPFLPAAFSSALTYELSQVKDKYELYKGSDVFESNGGGYQALSYSSFFGNVYEVPAWFLEKDGITVRFDPGAVAYRESGTVEVKIDYDYETGSLGDKYFPDFDTLLGEMEGDWYLFAGETEGDVWYAASDNKLGRITITEDGRMISREGYREDGIEYGLDDAVEMELILQEGGLWESFPALRHLEGRCPGRDGARFSVALDGNKLMLWYVDEQNYISFVQCYYRAEDPDRYAPACLQYRWIAYSREIPGLGTDYLCSTPEFSKEGDIYIELGFYFAGMPQVSWYADSYVGESEENWFVPGIVWEKGCAESPAEWFVTLSTEYDDGSSSAYNIMFLDENTLLVKEYYRMDDSAIPWVITYIFYRYGYNVG